jgi:hypothetical protein
MKGCQVHRLPSALFVASDFSDAKWVVYAAVPLPSQHYLLNVAKPSIVQSAVLCLVELERKRTSSKGGLVQYV